MVRKASIEFDTPRRFAFAASPSILRAMVPANTVGVYLLLERDRPFYVGRSDVCLRTRLSQHEHLAAATHVIWQSYRARLDAYRIEAAWYHALKERGGGMNEIHPAAPQELEATCPFCWGAADVAALHAALWRNRSPPETRRR